MAAEAVLDAAWDKGVRYYDVAPHYGLGLGEHRLGEGLADRPRADYLVSTKVGRLLVAQDNPQGKLDDEGFAVRADYRRKLDYSRDGVLRSVEESLERTGLDCFDIVFVHDPDEHYRDAMEGAFPALEELRSAGLIRSYGAGMNQTRMLTHFILHTDLDVVMIAGRYTLLEQGALDDLLPAAQARSVSVVAAAVYKSGLLARNRPSSDATYNYASTPAAILERVTRIAQVCERYSVSLPTAATQFPLGHPTVSTVCVGARTPEQITQNVQATGVKIPSALWAELKGDGLLRADAPVPDGQDASN
ncbi:aldo/keto reductase [Arthrobacter tecti]